MLWRRDTSALRVPTADEALPGRDQVMPILERHYVNGQAIDGPFPAGADQLIVGMGCFWGAERLYWAEPGVVVTAAGYAGGHTPNPTYEETCTGMTGHTEAVLVVYQRDQVSVERLLQIFWENHDPTQYMGQGNDIGTQYRSAIYTTTDAQLAVAERSRSSYQQELTAAGFGEITTEIAAAGRFYYAEPYHQQYLAKNPSGYCNHGFCQVPYKGVAEAAAED